MLDFLADGSASSFRIKDVGVTASCSLARVLVAVSGGFLLELGVVSRKPLAQSAIFNRIEQK